MTRIGFVGMTPLGLVSAAAAASKGFATLGVDPDRALIERLASHNLPVREPGLAELVEGSRSLSFSSELGDLGKCDLVYVAPDTPNDRDGRSDLRGVEALIAAVLPQLSAEAVLVLVAQVPPGFTRTIDWPAERRFYQVATLVAGRAVERAVEPESAVVGCADPGRPLPPPLAELLGAFGCPILPMRYESAELAKISINMCLAASISVANSMAELCERIGADWAEIAPALRLDRRIGPHAYLSPGLGLGGGNLERDLAAVVRLASAHGTDAEIAAAQMVNSRHRRNWAVDTVRRLGLDTAGQPLAVWGLAYKENTNSVKGSPALHTLAQLADARFQVHDPAVPEGAVPKSLARVRSPLQALDGAAALLVLTPWPEYRAIAPAAIADQLAGNDIIDPYRVLDRAAVRAAGLHHHTLGVGDA
jgi:UDPglucose 6-dehydrogenase